MQLQRANYMQDNITDPDGLKKVNAALRAAGLRFVRVVQPLRKGCSYCLKAMYGRSSPGYTFHKPEKQVFNQHRTRTRYHAIGIGSNIGKVDVDCVIEQAKAMEVRLEVYQRYLRMLKSLELRLRLEAIAATTSGTYRTAKSAIERAATTERKIEALTLYLKEA